MDTNDSFDTDLAQLRAIEEKMIQSLPPEEQKLARERHARMEARMTAAVNAIVQRTFSIPSHRADDQVAVTSVGQLRRALMLALNAGADVFAEEAVRIDAS